VKYIRIHVCENTDRMFAISLSHRDRKPKYISKFETKHGGDGKRWPLTPFPFLVRWPSHPPAIETPPRPVPAGPLISWPKIASCARIPPEQATPLSRRDDERQHAVDSHFALALCFYLAAYNTSSSCRFWVLDHLCSNWSQLFHFCGITQILSSNQFLPFLFCLCFPDRNAHEL